jgi:hypothetical protein
VQAAWRASGGFHGGSNGGLPFFAGVDVMIAIFCVSCHFSVKKIGGFLKNQCYDQIFAKN